MADTGEGFRNLNLVFIGDIQSLCRRRQGLHGSMVSQKLRTNVNPSIPCGTRGPHGKP